MKKTLRIGIIFLILIQMVTLGIVWAGSFYIIVYAPFCREKPIAVYVNDKDKISTLNSIWNDNRPTYYIYSGVWLLDQFSFSHYEVQSDDVIIAVRSFPKKDLCFPLSLKKQEQEVLRKHIRDLVLRHSEEYKVFKRLEDIYITNNENNLIREYIREHKNEDHDTKKSKIHTKVPPKATKPSTEPLPKFW